MVFFLHRTNIEKLAAEIKTMKIGSSQANVGHKPNKSKRNRSVQKYPKNPKDSSSSRKVIRTHGIGFEMKNNIFSATNPLASKHWAR